MFTLSNHRKTFQKNMMKFFWSLICRMRSIIDRLKGSRDFPRLRIGKVVILHFNAPKSHFFLLSFCKWLCVLFVLGIGRPPGKMDTANFVLRQFSRQEQEEVRRRWINPNIISIFQKYKKLIVAGFAVGLYIPNRDRSNKDSFA